MWKTRLKYMSLGATEGVIALVAIYACVELRRRYYR
jgi:hypothetical protein